MALQGTIDAFPLTDVLQLLATSSKSGRLTLDGDRGRAELWIEGGDVVGAGSGAGSSAEKLVFELLRYTDGSFQFGDESGTPRHGVEPVPLIECLERAGALLDDWRRIEAVVPSPAHRIGLARELRDSSVTLDRDDWAVVVAVGDMPTVEAIGERMAIDEFGCGAMLAALVERGVLLVEEPDRSANAPRSVTGDKAVDSDQQTDSDDSHLGSDLIARRDEGGTDGFPDRFPIDDLLGGSDPGSSSWEDDDESGRFAAAQTLEPAASDPFTPFGGDLNERTAEAWDEVVAGHGVGDPDEDLSGRSPHDGADEVLRQMSRLSPKAAEAIAAALNTSGPAETIVFEPLADDDGDGPSPFLGTL